MLQILIWYGSEDNLVEQAVKEHVILQEVNLLKDGRAILKVSNQYYFIKYQEALIFKPDGSITRLQIPDSLDFVGDSLQEVKDLLLNLVSEDIVPYDVATYLSDILNISQSLIRKSQ